MNGWRWQRIAEIQLEPNTPAVLDLSDFLYSQDRLQNLKASCLRIIGGISLLAMALLLITGWYFSLNRRLRVEIDARRGNLRPSCV